MRILLVLLCLGMTWKAQAQLAQIQQKAWAGEPSAMVELAHKYSLGDDVDRNEDSAKKYIDLAAKKGHPDAQFLLGSRLTASIYDAKKYGEGISWLKKAADQNQEDALVKLSAIYRTRDGGDSETSKYYDLKVSYGYAEKAANLGNASCLRYCAESRLKGTGTTRNDSIAIAYMRMAAEKHKDAVANCRVGDFYLEGKVTGTADPLTAAQWYQRALALPYLNMDQRNMAEYGLFRVDKAIKLVHNGMMNASGLTPNNAFQYPIRKD